MGGMADVQEMLSEIGRNLLPESDGPDDFFLMLRSLEHGLPKLSDPLTRIQRIIDRVASMKWNGSIKQQLIDSGVLNIDEVEEVARKTGNWTRFLSMASKHEKAVR